MSEKSYEKSEDELKSKIYEAVKKLSSLNEGFVGYVHIGEIKRELPNLDDDTLTRLLDELVCPDNRLVTLEIGNSFTFYIPKRSEILKEKKR